MKGIRSYLISVVFSTLLHFCAFVFPSMEASSQMLPFRRFTTKDELPSNRVTALFQDSKGFVWIGTDAGLTIYDGATFKTLTVVDGLPNPFVTDIIESRLSPGTLWIASITKGISRYEHGALRAWKFDNRYLDITVGSIVEDDVGTIWCSTTQGVFKVSGDSLAYVPILPREYVSGGDIVRQADGTIMVGMNRRIYVQSPPERTVGTIELDFKGDAHMNRMMVDRDGDLWVSGSDSTLRRFVGGRLATTWHSGLIGIVNKVITDTDGDLWIAGVDGLLRGPKRDFPNHVSLVYGGTKNLNENYLEPMIEDREGEIWVGGMNIGLQKYAQKNSIILPIANNGIAVCDRRDHIWVPNGNDTWECWKESAGPWQVMNHPAGKTSDRSTRLSMCNDSHGRLWSRYADFSFACDSILQDPRGGSTLRRMRTLRSGKDFSGRFIGISYIDPGNILWIASDSVMEAFDLSTPRLASLGTLSYPGEVHCRNVRSIYRDAKSNIWIGGFAEGLDELVGGDLARKEIRHFTTEKGLPDNAVRSIGEDARGRIWIGTRYGGVAIFDGTSFQSLSIKDGLLSNAVWSLASDKAHRMWLGTGSGAMSVDIDSLPGFRWSEVNLREVCTVFNTGAAGEMWILDYHSAIVERGAVQKISPPPVWITSVTVNNVRREFSSPPELSYVENNCAIEYAGVSFRSERLLRYQYRLNGIASEWSPPMRNRAVSFAALAPGAYAFEVRAITGDGTVSPSPATFSFTIVPPVWERWWFRSLVGLIFLALGPTIYFRRVSRLKHEKSLQNEFARRLIDSQEHERKRIAAELHDSLGQNLLVIQNHTILAMDQAAENDGIRERLREISSVATQAIGDVREIALNLRPYHLDKLGLTTSINAIIRRVSESAQIRFDAEIDPIDGLFSKEEESNLYRIIQEALNNIVKHAAATHVSAVVQKTDDNIRIVITDDGRGFILPDDASGTPAPSGDGFGLVGMKERVRILNGTLTMRSAPGNGTSLTIDVPYTGGEHG